MYIKKNPFEKFSITEYIIYAKENHFMILLYGDHFAVSVVYLQNNGYFICFDI